MNFADRVQDISQSIGTGNFVLSGVQAAGYQLLAAHGGVGSKFYYTIVGGTQFESGQGTITAANTFSRSPTSSSSGGALVNFNAGTKTVFTDATADWLNKVLTLDNGVSVSDYLAANPGSTIAPGDNILVVQGNAVVGESASALATFAIAQYPAGRTKAVRITTPGTYPLDSTTHNRRRLIVVVAGVIFTGPNSYGSVGDDFECEVVNLSAGVVTFGTGLNVIPSGTTLAVGGRAVIFSTAGAMYVSLGSAAAPDTVAPTAVSAAVSNASPTVVVLTMSEAMDSANTPAASAFTVGGHTVSSVAVSGNTISLTCSAAFVNGEAARTVAYTQPGTANARDLAQNLLANFSGLAITNNVGVVVDTTAPTLTSPTSNSVATNEANGTLYRFASTNPTETAAVVKAANLTSTVTAAGVQTVAFTGLTASTTYYAHYVHRDAAGNDSVVANSASFTTPAAGAGTPGVAPFTATARSGYPLTMGTGATDFLWHDIIATGSATIVGVTGAMSTSNTVVPTSAIGAGTSPKGRYIGALTNYNNVVGSWLVQGPTMINYSTPATDFYLWLQVTDSNGAIWNFCHSAPINIGDSVARTSTTSTTPTPQVQS